MSRTAADAPVLVFGDDTSAFLGAVRSLGRKGLEVHGAGSGHALPAYASRYIAAHHIVPPYRGDGKEWLEAVQSLTREHGFGMLVPTSDASLIQLAAHAEDLSPARCAVPSPTSLALFTDKWKTREAARALGIPVAEGMLICPSDSAEKVAAKLGLPLILKERRSYARGEQAQKTDVALIASARELAHRMAGGADMIAETFIPGFCRGVSVLAHEGEVLQAFQHCRLGQEHATGPSSSRVSEALDARLLDAAQKLIAHAHYSGIAMFEFRCHDQGNGFALLEVNPRVWGSIQLAMDAGADYVAALHGLIVGAELPARRMDFPAGRQKRSLFGEWDRLAHAWEDAAGVAAHAAIVARLFGYFSSMASGSGYDSFASDDPAPFLRERAVVLSRMRDKLHKALPRAIAGART